MQLTILAAFAVAVSLLEMPHVLLAVPGEQTAAAIALYWGGAAGLSLLAGRLALHNLTAGRTPRRLGAQRLTALASHLWLVGGLAGVLMMGYGHFLLYDLRLIHAPWVAVVSAVAVFTVALGLNWLAGYPLHVLTRRRLAQSLPFPVCKWSLGQYLSHTLRHQLLFLAVPILTILLIRDVLGLYICPSLPTDIQGWVFLLGTLASMIGVFLLSPLAIIHLWRTRSLPEGPLRRQLEHVLRSLNVRCRDIRVWHTDGVIANAAAVGIFSPLRYILLSDLLVERLDEPRLRAVFAHEAGHVREHHVFYATLFAVSSVMLIGVLVDAAMMRFSPPEWVGQTAAALLLAAWLPAFGWFSRRLERQSDVIGAWAGGDEASRARGDITPDGAAAFAWALQAIAALSGLPLGQFNWRHGSIAQRCQYILTLGAAGGNRQPLDRFISRLKLALWLLLAVVIALVMWQGWA